MLQQPVFAMTDSDELSRIVASHPWVTLASSVNGQLQISHLPVVLDETADGLAVLGHMPRADARLHQLGSSEAALIVQGPHGYLSPSWYINGVHVPTWDYVVVHLYGTPDLLSDEDTYTVLTQTVDHLEAHLPRPWSLGLVEQHARRILPRTTGFRFKPNRVVGKAKLHQDEPREDAIAMAAALEASGHPTKLELAGRIRIANQS